MKRLLTFFWLVFIALFVLSGCSSDSNNSATENKTEDNLTGEWYCVKKDSSGMVTAITFLNIKDAKTAQMDSYELTNNKFSDNEPNKLLWRWGSLNVNMKRSGKNLEFSVKVPDGDDIKVLECKYDSSAQKLTADKDIFTKDAVDIQKLKDESIQQYKNYLEGQGTKIEIVADMSETEYKDYINQQIFGIR